LFVRSSGDDGGSAARFMVDLLVALQDFDEESIKL